MTVMHPACEMIRRSSFVEVRGEVIGVGQNSIEARGPLCSIGDICVIATRSGGEISAEVVSTGERSVRLLPLSSTAGIRPGAAVKLLPERSVLPVGDGFAGRAINAFAEPIDGAGPIADESSREIRRGVPGKLDRVVVPERQHGGLAAVGAGDLGGELDGALLVRAHGEARVAAVDALAVLGEDDLARGVHDPLHADERIHHHLIRSLVGSRSGVASTEPTVTG